MDESIVFWNSHSLLSNLSEFKVFLYGLKPAITFVSETWFRNKTSVTFVNYSQVRLDRNDRCGGGVLFLVRNDIMYNCVPLSNYQNGTLEVLAINVYFNKFNCTVVGLYNPASALFTTAEFSHFINQVHSQKLLIIGDFNAKHITWSKGIMNSAGRALHSFLLSSSSLCLLSTPFMTTHLDVASGSTSTLDLCIGSSYFLQITKCRTGSDIGSNHLYLSLLNCQVLQLLKVNPFIVAVGRS
jgi:hypothetical protein